jgi:hypothetical protein
VAVLVAQALEAVESVTTGHYEPGPVIPLRRLVADDIRSRPRRERRDEVASQQMPNQISTNLVLDTERATTEARALAERESV